MKCLILFTLALIIVQPAASYSEQNGSLEILVEYTNGDRVDPWDMVLKIYQDSYNNPIAHIDTVSSNPYVLTSIPLNHKYLIDVYKNRMYAGSGSIDLISTQSKIDVKIALSGGMRFNVFYDDGVTPVEGALVSIKTRDGNLLRQTTTDSEGKTLRFWLQSTIIDSDYYRASVSMGKNIVYEHSLIRLEPALRKEINVVTPWPSKVDQFLLSVYKTSSEAVNESDGRFNVELQNVDSKKVIKSAVNRKGDAFFTNIPIGEYAVRVFREREGLLYDLEEWGSKNITLASKQVSMKFVRSEPFINSWQLTNVSSTYRTLFSALIHNPAHVAKNVTIALILDKDRMLPYDIVQNVTLTIPAQNLENVEMKIIPDEIGTYYAFIITSINDSVVTDQVGWLHAYDVTDLSSISSYTTVSKSEQNSPVSSSIPYSCKCVAFRLDDVQDYFTRDAQKDLINMFLDEHAPLTIGIIGGYLHEDRDLIEFLQNAVSKGSIEVANHSWNHKDHSVMAFDEQQDSIVKTNERIEELFGVRPKTFIPPENAFNEQTLVVMQQNGLTHISGSVFTRPDRPPYPLKDGDSIFHFPQTAFVSNVDTPTGKWTVLANEQVLERIRKSVDLHGFAVVSMHPVAYYDRDGSNYIYEKERIEALRDLLRELKKEFAMVTISEIDKQGWIPKYSKEIPIIEFNGDHGFRKQSLAGMQLDENNDFVKGMQSLQLVSDGNGIPVFTRKMSINPSLDLSNKYIKVWVKVTDTNYLQELWFYLSSDNFLSSWYTFKIDNDIKLKNNIWIPITLTFDEAVVTGSPDITNINAIQWRIRDKGTGIVAAYWGGMSAVSPVEYAPEVVLHEYNISWNDERIVVKSNADINVKMQLEKIYIERNEMSYEPLLLFIPTSVMPDRPIVYDGVKALPSMSWLDEDKETWVVYVDHRSEESLHVVPEFNLALLTLASTFGFLIFVRFKPSKCSMHRHDKLLRSRLC
ncbi:MAG: polysaccharide deacetylase family protein [Nitrososphaerales archaeon]